LDFFFFDLRLTTYDVGGGGGDEFLSGYGRLSDQTHRFQTRPFRNFDRLVSVARTSKQFI
jgi:hypothetical protein